ncbi:LysR substrate-binding domain-containing protein [Lysobacter soli]|uniref:LysR substrate-binding domain-containing protein n=1 Tax=Lysobacter soli TaxID=453783 RepID=UPI0020A10CE0|nr:LysR substrate-binding domain-containing protein [Lysobacter soli]UTA53203.1 LysR substrate-binding domain-containing protein [Lysobacter soli]
MDEGIDVALRITHLSDSTLVAQHIGEARRVVVASPRYLATHPRIEEPGDLSQHAIVTMQHMGLDSWSFPPPEGSTVPRSVSFVPRLVVNNVQAAVGSAVDGHGVTRLLSYHVAAHVERDELRVLLPGVRTGPASHQPRVAVRAVVRAESSGVRRLRLAAAAGAVRPRHARIVGGDSTVSRKNVCRNAWIRTAGLRP